MGMQPEGIPPGAGARAGRLIQNTLALARLRLNEARGDASTLLGRMALGVALGAAAFVLVLLALPILVTMVVLILAIYVPPWAAVAIVLAAMLAASGALLLLARRRLRWRPLRLVEAMRSDWAAIRARLEERR